MTYVAGYTFHMGKWAEQHLKYLDACAVERGMARSKLVQHLLNRVLGDRMIDELIGAYDPTKSQRLALRVARAPRMDDVPRSTNLFVEPIEEVTNEPKQAHRSLPEPSRKTTSPPLPEPRPARYIGRRTNIASNWSREKTKNQLREELRQAVENTR
jgi:hypothetical protein